MNHLEISWHSILLPRHSRILVEKEDDTIQTIHPILTIDKALALKQLEEDTYISNFLQNLHNIHFLIGM